MKGAAQGTWGGAALLAGLLWLAAPLPHGLAHEHGAAQPPPAGPPRALIGAPFTLVTHERQPVTDQSFRGHWLLVFFGYTSCPDVCPTTLATLTEAFARLGPDAQKLRGLFITLDPKQDTPDLLAAYIANFSPRITAATGTEAQVTEATRVFRVRYEIESDVKTGRYTISHPVALMLFDPQGRFVSLIPGGASAAEVEATVAGFMRKRR